MLSEEWFLQPGVLLLALPVVALLLLVLFRSNGRGLAVPLPGYGWVPPSPDRSKMQIGAAAVMRALSLLALVPLMTGPTQRPGLQEHTAAGALFVVLDNSSSMTAGDFGPFNRLDTARRSLKDFVMRLPETEIGLVALAGSPQIIAPVTPDRRFLLGTIEKIGPAEYEDDGTAIGSGVASAVNRLRHGGNGPLRVLLITDGVSNRGAVSAADAAEVARAMGIQVDAIGIGTDTVSRFSVPTGDGLPQNVEARIEIDDRALEALAARTGGRYTRARTPADLERALARLEATYVPPQAHRSRYANNRWVSTLALVALCLAGIEMMLRHFIVREIPN